ncbi:hypothetical protein QQX98_000215 [Neonectria punicea]|uniref:Histidine kinase group protein n=1 Tax=Neonectria punicea TaxID=979145 RepID=A0ABR1HVS9_9HYPO
MDNNDSKQPPSEAEQAASGGSSANFTMPMFSTGPRTGPGGAKKKCMPLTPLPATLAIARNKHWRYISYFHGHWLQMPLELLETIANINFNTPRPRPIDAAVLFDVVKIRRLVDEATNLAVRAASDIASPVLTNVHGGLPPGGAASLLVPGGAGHGGKLSRERKFRMREQASQKLAHAYRLDEIACSVAAMQGASPLEDVGALVLQRNPEDMDAKYVSFFHEKIPSRELVESTSLKPLSEIISQSSTEGEALRTRSMVKTFRNDYEGAAHDLTLAMSACRHHQPPGSPAEAELQLQQSRRDNRRPPDIILAEKDQPTGFQGQVLFQRAAIYLILSCQHIANSLPPAQDADANTEPENSDKTPASETNDGGLPPASETNDGGPSAQDKEQKRKQAESRKLVKIYAKKALRDYMAFLAQFDYAPSMPLRVPKVFNDRINLAAAQGIRNPRSSDSGPRVKPYASYSIPDLFAPIPLSDIPPYPPGDLPRSGTTTPLHERTCESVSYHPLLVDALHSVLLCHCLVQTSAKELHRHANMVARLTRLSDGYPIFQPSRSSARTDWIEVLGRADNWIQLTDHWEVLSAPRPVPNFDAQPEQGGVSSPGRAASAAAALINGGLVAEVAEEQRKKQAHEQAILEALNDDRVHDETTFRGAVQAREKRAEEDERIVDASSTNDATNNAGTTNAPTTVRRWTFGEGGEYTILTARAIAIARWVREAPMVTGTARRKKRTKKPAKADESLGDALEKLQLQEDEA